MSKLKLPKPMGYRILVALPPKLNKTKGGLILPDGQNDREYTASICGNVLALGPDCYLDGNKFPNGPWCKKGDWVIFRSYSGTRFKIGEQEFRMINDDTVEGTVDDPRSIERAY